MIKIYKKLSIYESFIVYILNIYLKLSVKILEKVQEKFLKMENPISINIQLQNNDSKVILLYGSEILNKYFYFVDMNKLTDCELKYMKDKYEN